MSQTTSPRFIFITGGVVSSLGKGLAAAALAALLQARGFRVRLRKFDPYLNVDPGTMSPFQHGEVFVTDDGAETDLDLGHYERFSGVSARRSDSVTMGRVYSTVLAKERRGDYLGATIQVVPHITNQISEAICADTDGADFIICEIGGTVGDIEGQPILEAVRQLRNGIGHDRVVFIHATWLPWIATAGELKTKPTQHSVRELLHAGIQPDLLLCRADQEIPEGELKKISLFCNIRPERVIPALNVDTIYAAPLTYHDAGLDTQVLNAFGIGDAPEPDLSAWQNIVGRIREPKGEVTIGIVGKYVSLPDAYKSLVEALTHGGIANNVRVTLHWIDSEELEGLGEEAAAGDDCAKLLCDVNAILVPGGFGVRGAEGMIKAIRYARENKIPYFGICFGMQLAVIESARNLGGLTGAGSTEFGACAAPVVGLMTEWRRDDGKMTLETRNAGSDLGGTMRLGAYKARLTEGSRVSAIYGGATEIEERHRHRYEVNLAYRDALEKAGIPFAGVSPDGVLPEIIDRADHPWFIAVQFHPELKSRPLAPHPLFVAFVAAARAHAIART